MVLDLYIAECEGRRVDVSGMCLASGVPPTTALRYVDLLIEDGLIAKVGDARDGRRRILSIGATLRTAIDGWLDQAETSLAIAGWSASEKAIPPQDGEADRSRSP